MQQAKQIISAYRKDDWADPEGFLAQLGMKLECYPDDIIKQVTNPYSGIQTKSDFPPTLAAIVRICDAEIDRRKRINRWNAMRREERPMIAQRADLRNVLIPKENPLYADFVERTKTGDIHEFRFDERGIWVPESAIKAKGYVGAR